MLSHHSIGGTLKMKSYRKNIDRKAVKELSPEHSKIKC